MTTANAPTLNGDSSASAVATLPPKTRRPRPTVVAAVPAPAPEQAGDPVLALIERVARDPRADLDKLERLLDMRAKAEANANERAFNEALSKAQAEMEPIRADAKNDQTRSRHASYASLNGRVKPIYTRHGFALTFSTGAYVRDSEIEVVAYLIGHGHSRRYSAPMACDGKGARGGDVMSRTHATASAITYGKRYLLDMIFDLAVIKDDDGNAAGRTGGGAIAPEQVERIRSLATAVKADEGRFCAFMGVASIEAIPAGRFEHAIAALAAKGSKSLATGDAPPVKVAPCNSERALAARANAGRTR